MEVIPDQLFDVVVHAATEVFENMLFVSIYPVAGSSPLTGQVIHGRIRYQGPHSATVHLYLPADLALRLAGDFLGEGTPDEELVLDACAEVANMVAGRHLKSLSPDARLYRLAMPQVAVEIDPVTPPQARTFTTGRHLLQLALEVEQ
ncbi:MAG TPA: chemotaxis protein CheX [bacterium]|jgi:CheY-specific phosphatase CheX